MIIFFEFINTFSQFRFFCHAFRRQISRHCSRDWFVVTFNNDIISDFRVCLKIFVCVLKRIVRQHRWLFLRLDDLKNDSRVWIIFRKSETFGKQSFAGGRHYCSIEHEDIRIIESWGTEGVCIKVGVRLPKMGVCPLITYFNGNFARTSIPHLLGLIRRLTNDNTSVNNWLGHLSHIYQVLSAIPSWTSLSKANYRRTFTKAWIALAMSKLRTSYCGKRVNADSISPTSILNRYHTNVPKA